MIFYISGSEYIYEVHRASTLGPSYYVCTLCDEGKFDMNIHMTNQEHCVAFFVSTFLTQWPLGNWNKILDM